MAPTFSSFVMALDTGSYLFAAVLTVVAALIVTAVMVLTSRSESEDDF